MAERRPLKLALILSGCFFVFSQAYADVSPPQKTEHFLEAQARCISGILEIKGTTDLSDGSSIHVFLGRRGDFAPLADAIVVKGRFGAIVNFSRHSVLPGDYEIKAVFNKAKPLESRCAINIGSPEEASIVAEQYKTRRRGEIEELKKFFAELQSKYETQTNNPDEKSWEEWSKVWFAKLGELELSRQKESQRYLIGLFPKAEQDIKDSILALAYLHQKLSYELNLAPNFKEGADCPYAKKEMEELDRDLKTMLAEAEKDLK